jgi:hypothetical protein
MNRHEGEYIPHVAASMLRRQTGLTPAPLRVPSPAAAQIVSSPFWEFTALNPSSNSMQYLQATDHSESGCWCPAAIAGSYIGLLNGRREVCRRRDSCSERGLRERMRISVGRVVSRPSIRSRADIERAVRRIPIARPPVSRDRST